ncbi:hypothetical protein [Anaerosalibacter sp. Marseille-P3206]|uniref:hypothetical protein n=1 Tax=Anaerosalibacter sp. Marseille-P3206 TaxID=1871005 RepID=UPI0009853C42|nr:hypothetical protein [Anaerosalibacter sp. Marseille-P3206]
MFKSKRFLSIFLVLTFVLSTTAVFAETNDVEPCGPVCEACGASMRVSYNYGSWFWTGNIRVCQVHGGRCVEREYERSVEKVYSCPKCGYGTSVQLSNQTKWSCS